jgi:hypothetical protein
MAKKEDVDQLTQIYGELNEAGKEKLKEVGLCPVW